MGGNEGCQGKKDEHSRASGSHEDHEGNEGSQGEKNHHYRRGGSSNEGHEGNESGEGLNRSAVCTVQCVCRSVRCLAYSCVGVPDCQLRVLCASLARSRGALEQRPSARLPVRTCRSHGMRWASEN